VEVKAARRASFVLVALLAAGAARAETSQVSSGGFTVSHTLAVEADAERAWQAVTQPQRWWSSKHTWSGDAANLSLDAQAGGCWCERRASGASVMHGRVLMAQPGALLRLQAWLGPLQELPAAGVLTLAVARRDGLTQLRVSYRVAGGADAGLDRLAAPVDAVIGEQVRRLKRLIETGQPE
jgi:uncharacterized protein YndB with AHSA1/START domain